MFARVSNDWHEITGEDEAFFLRVYGPGDLRFRGADLGILVTKGRMQTAEGLTRAAGATSTASAVITSRSHCRIPQPCTPLAYVK